MKQNSRRRVAAESVQHGESPCSKGRAEETYSYKTPKRSQVSRSRLPTFSSPGNETDMQQEIFWDPQSPVTYKLGNNKKKQAINRHTVEISEIVNRIAPQDEKPACYEGSLLGLWIGEDAIPCTPGITKVRSRTKMNVARDLQLKNGEEELMKLAKQFDKNLTDSTQEQCILQPNAVSVVSEAKLSTEHQGKVQAEEKQWLHNEHPENNNALSLEIPRGTAETFENPKRNSQKFVDPDVEGALNSLFDCSTQKCSGQLSQDLSSCSSTSVVQVFQEEGILLEGENLLVKGGSQGHGATLLKPVLAEKAKIHSEQTLPGADFPKIGPAACSYPDKAAIDDSDDWGADLFSDDSLLMQITEEPKSMKTEENTAVYTSKEKGGLKERTTSSEIAQTGGVNSSSTVRVLCSSSTKQNIWTGKGKVIPLCGDGSFETNKVDSLSKNRQNNPLDYCIAMKSENRSIQQGFTQLKCAANASSPIKRTASLSVSSDLSKHLPGKLKGHMHGTDPQASIVPTDIKLHDPKTAGNHGSSGYLKQTSVVKRRMCSFDDWKEPKFSDEVLEVFDESTSFWGIHCDDDDDLLYQVCDDVEKNTLSQMGVKETGKVTLMERTTSNLQTGLCHAGSIQGLFIYPQAQKSHTGRKTFSLDPPVATKRNESSANSPARLESNFASGTGSASVSRHNCQQSVGKPYSNCSINQMSLTKKSKDVFKTISSQTLVKGHKNVTGSLSVTNLGLWESKNRTNVPFQNVISRKPDFKRHHSIDFVPYEKEHKSRRCSQEEIARKKQEAIERRKCKMDALLKNTAPT